METESKALRIARTYHRAWSEERFGEAAGCLADHLAIEVPINSYATKAEFIRAVERTRTMAAEVRVLAELGDDREAFLLYDMALPFGLMRVAEHFTVTGDHISRIRQIHDTAAIRAAMAASNA